MKHNTRILALYLPQFYQTTDNDRWWGEGFTDWVAVRKAVPLFQVHYQPRVPHGGNYYNLLQHDVMEWQAKLAEKYGISGFCFYHYWFEEGRRMLEKPAENLLRWKEIYMPFCFCWANESWIRTWSNLGTGNVWADLYDTSGRQEDGAGVLIAQKYGREKQWKKHFDYLLPFFQDKRYIRHQGKPVFVIYKPAEIYCLGDMAAYWNAEAEKSGLPGIYIIGMQEEGGHVDAYCRREPNHAAQLCSPHPISGDKGETAAYDYGEIWEKILEGGAAKNKKTYLCGVTDYDSTPRKGKNGWLMNGASPDDFYQYFKRLLEQSIAAEHEFLFINAWNEWGEGMYLEPDERHGFGYLEAVKRCVEEADPLAAKAWRGKEDGERQDTVKRDAGRILKLRSYIDILDKWLMMKESGGTLAPYFRRNHFQVIAVYGMGVLGRHLLRELADSGIQIAYVIDRNEKLSIPGILTLTPEDSLPRVDAVVVTPISDYHAIAEKLRKLTDCPVISLTEVIYEQM